VKVEVCRFEIRDLRRNDHKQFKEAIMSRRWLLFSFCLSRLLVLVPLSSANVTLSINESATRVLFESEATMVVLSVANPLNKLVDAHTQLELIGPEGVVRGTTQRDHQIKSGVSTIAIPVNLWLNGEQADTRELLWYGRVSGHDPTVMAASDS
jgi:hypothetical protein